LRIFLPKNSWRSVESSSWLQLRSTYHIDTAYDLGGDWILTLFAFARSIIVRPSPG